MRFHSERFPQLRSPPGVAFRARRFRGGRGRRGWPSSRTSSWWTGSWWCRSPASTTSTPRPTSDTPTPWRRRARRARRRRTEGDPCCSTSIKRWVAFVSQLTLFCDFAASLFSFSNMFFIVSYLNFYPSSSFCLHSTIPSFCVAFGSLLLYRLLNILVSSVSTVWTVFPA